jgi:hypothetical protein
MLRRYLVIPIASYAMKSEMQARCDPAKPVKFVTLSSLSWSLRVIGVYTSGTECRVFESHIILSHPGRRFRSEPSIGGLLQGPQRLETLEARE